MLAAGVGVGTPFGGVAGFWNIANLFASQASYDASPSAGKTLLTQAVAQSLGIVNSVATTNPPGTVTRVDGTLGYGAHNLCLHSANMLGGAWAGSNAVASDAQTISISTSAGYFTQGITSGIATGAAFNMQCQIMSGTKTGTIKFRDANGTATTTVTLTGAWQAITLAGTAAAGGVNPTFDTRVAQGGDGGTGTIFVRYVQVNLGPTALDYVPTTTAAVYGPRFTFDRGAGSNAVINSDTLTNASFSKADITVVADGLTVPGIGSLTYTVTDNANNSNHSLGLDGAGGGFTTVSGSAYCMSAVVGQGTGRYAQLFFFAGMFGVNAYANFDLLSGIVGTIGSAATAGIIPLGSGLYRVWMSAPATGSGTGYGAANSIPASSSARNLSYAGTGTTLRMAAIQVNPGTTPQAYLRTFATAPLYTAGTPRSQNLLANSSDLSAWSVNAASKAGTETLTITESATSSWHGAYKIAAVPAPVPGATYTYSTRFRRGVGSRNFLLFLDGPGSLRQAIFSGADGSVVTKTAGVEASCVVDGADFVARMRVVWPAVTGAVNVYFQIADGATDTYLGDGASSIIAGKLHVYEGTADLAYTATTGTAYSEYPQAGLLREVARTNLALWCRDLTNAAWTASSVTVAKTATGIDGVANSASTLTASGANGTVLQAITSASAARITSAYVRRKTGTGTINMTQDNGTTWTVITPQAYWSQIPIPSATAANPTIGFRIVTSGDAIEVDYVQHELGAFVTSPIGTTSAAVARDADLERPPTTWVSATAQTSLFEFAPATVTDSVARALLASGTTGLPVYLSTVGAGAIYDGTNATATANVVLANVTNMIATRYSVAGIGASLNGGSIATSSFTSMGGTPVAIGDDGTARPFSGLITRISIASRAANDADLQAASAGTL